MGSSTAQPTTSTAGIPHPTMLYLRNVLVMSDGCLDVSLTVNLKKGNTSVTISCNRNVSSFALFKHSRWSPTAVVDVLVTLSSLKKKIEFSIVKIIF